MSIREDDEEPPVEARVQIEISMEDPVRGLCKLARCLARLLGLGYEDPPTLGSGTLSDPGKPR